MTSCGEPSPDTVQSRTLPAVLGAFDRYAFVDIITQGYVAVVGVLILLFHNGTVPRWPWLVAVHVFLLLLIHTMVQCSPPGGSVRSPVLSPSRGGSFLTSKAFDLLRHFYPVLLYAFLFCETGWVNRMFFGQYLDATLLRWEQAVFGLQPSLLFMAKLPYLLVSEAFYASYFSYYLMIGGIGIALFFRERREFFHYVSVLSFLFYVCYLCYIVLPIVGPPVLFRQVPAEIPQQFVTAALAHPYPEALKNGPFFQLMAWIYQVAEAPGAAFPSSHVAVALCTVSFSFRYLRRIRWVHLALAVLLCLSTVYCRYHYLLDVLAGVAAAAVLVPLGNRLYFRFGESNSGHVMSRS